MNIVFYSINYCYESYKAKKQNKILNKIKKNVKNIFVKTSDKGTSECIFPKNVGKL